MLPWKILAVVCGVIFITEANTIQANTTEICAPAHLNTNKIQCLCTSDRRKHNHYADCYLTDKSVTNDDKSWDAFEQIKNVSKITLSNMKGVVLKYIPTKALKHIAELLKIDVKYASIERIQAFAFGNLTSIEEFALRDNQISVLEPYAFAHHSDALIISLDKNNIFEINRNVFFDMPRLDKLYLTSNNITIIHDRAFMHLPNLKELELDSNSLFSLNSETFFGLRRLQKLDLSINSLEVIGDNTFLPLVNLVYLNLQSNKIQMLDDKAFHGLTKLKSLALAHNKLVNIENTGVFKDLNALSSLSLKDNKLKELRKAVMDPILENFYGTTGSFDVEDNEFPCDCRLEWFEAFMNSTVNENLKNALHNLKCSPSNEIQDMWSKLKQNNPEKNTNEPVFDDTGDAQNTEFEYYDDTELNGKLFYFDLKDFKLLKCLDDGKTMILNQSHTSHKTVVTNSTAKDQTRTNRPLATNRPVSVTPVAKYITNQITNHGVLNLSDDETSTTTSKVDNAQSSTMTSKSFDNINRDDNKIRDPKKDSVTTSHLATVSAKPIEHKKDYEENMPSDEGMPDRIKSQRSVQEIKNFPNHIENLAQRNFSCLLVLSSILVFSLLF